MSNVKNGKRVLPVQRDVKISKYLSKILRHNPQRIGVELDSAGWVDIDVLLDKVGMVIDRTDLERVVAESDKKRFAISDDGLRIRANQGHSVDVDLGLDPAVPPNVLYHGTVEGILDSILQEGLKPMGRQHVHLSADVETATKVGARRGKPVILEIASGQMAQDGKTFWCSDNGVWLTDHVPPSYLTGWPKT